MFCINIALGNTSWRLLFKDGEKARESFNYLFPPMAGEKTCVQLTDDFGQQLALKLSAIHGAMLENMDETKMAHIEVALHQARTQNAAQRAAQSDPSLKSPMIGGGPAVLTPGMNNGRGF